MRHLRSYAVMILALLLVAGCSNGESATDDTVAASEPPAISTLAPTTTEAPTTTAVVTEAASTAAATQEAAGEGSIVDEALAPAFVAGVRDVWERAERTVGGTAPDLSDEEIVAVGAAMCEHMAANWDVDIDPQNPEETMPAFTELAVIAADGLGLNYDPAMQDAGFDNGFDARLVVAFNQVAAFAEEGGLCPFGEGPLLFHSPWSARASD